MFFDEDDSKNKENSKINYGAFTPNSNLDIDMSFYEVNNEKIYPRWKYHFFLFSSLIFILSCNYPIFFLILFFDIIIQIGLSRGIMAILEGNELDYSTELQNSQLEGGDIRLSPYIFLCYDSLGYVIYGISSVGPSICSEIYEYDNYLGLQDKIIICSFNKDMNIEKIKNNNKYISKYANNIKCFNFYKIKFTDISLDNLSYFTSNIRCKIRKDKINYYFFSNSDRSFSYFHFNKKQS